MAQPGFYNTNRFRAYPFITDTVANPIGSAGTIQVLDNNTVVDAGFVMGLYSGYIAGQHTVWLDSVVRSGDIVTFTFACDAPGLYQRPLTFTRDLVTDGQYAVEHVDDVEQAYGYSESSDSPIFEVSNDLLSECPPEPLWSGYLVTGDMMNLAATLTDGEHLTGSISFGVVEPALVQNVSGGYVSSINIANLNRVRVTAPVGCSDVVWDFPNAQDTIYVTARCLRGDVRFVAGYNAALRQEDFNNAVVIGADVGAGAGPVCNNEPKLFPGETPPLGDSDESDGLLEGGPRCNEVIRSINGVGGKFASLLNGLGVNISIEPSMHTVIIDVNMTRLTVCYSDHPFSEVSEILS